MVLDDRALKPVKPRAKWFPLDCFPQMFCYSDGDLTNNKRPLLSFLLATRTEAGSWTHGRVFFFF